MLISNLKDDENVTSSHWDKYHRDFKVNSDGSIEGIIGFGGFEEKTLIRSFLHKSFQKRFRKLAVEYNDFGILDSEMYRITDLQDRTYNLDVLRQTLTLALLKYKLKNHGNFDIAVVIGDGFASMSSLLLASKFVKKVILINLSKTLLVDIEYFSKISNYYSFTYCLVNEENDLIYALNSSEFNLVTIQASNQSFLKLIPADLVINIASMQEMNNEIIQRYFEDMRSISKKKDLYFYCCNREEKKLPDGTVTAFKKYPWKGFDEILMDELCPWHQDYYSFIPPFHRLYDGPIRHRLVKLN